MSYGKLEGMTFVEINHLYPEVATSIEKRDCLVSFPGGECFTDLAGRVAKVATELKRFPGSKLFWWWHTADR